MHMPPYKGAFSNRNKIEYVYGNAQRDGTTENKANFNSFFLNMLNKNTLSVFEKKGV